MPHASRPRLHRLPLLVLCLASFPLCAQTPDVKHAAAGLLSGRCAVGDIWHYRMDGDNDGRRYTIHATETVKKNPAGDCYASVAWSGYTSKPPQTMSPATLALRQAVSMDDRRIMGLPDLSRVQPFMVGPITDMLTFYADLFLARKLQLATPGQTADFAYGAVNSWADGHIVSLGQDSIDFHLAVVSVDKAAHTATFRIEHVPPANPRVFLIAPWMKQPVAGTPNNWVQITKTGDHFSAAVGKETFGVLITVDTSENKVLHATMHNPLITSTRTCADSVAQQCGSPTPGRIVRDITLTLEP